MRKIQEGTIKVMSDNISQWRNFSAIFVLVIVSFSFTAHAQTKHSSGSESSRSLDRIGFVVNGQLMTQMSGGAPRLSSPSEKAQWHKQGPIRMIPLTSPNGSYTVVTKDTDAMQAGFHVVRVYLNKQVLAADAIYATNGRAGFDGWLPDSQHVAIWGFDHIAGLNGQRRFILDVKTGRKIKFNGWLSSDGAVAIVPSQETQAEETSERQGVSGWTDSPPIHYYVVQMPSHILQYQLAKQSRKELMLDTKPFVGLRKLFGLLFCGSEDHLVRHPACVDFSSDHQWAICHGLFYVENSLDTYTIDYLVSIKTGKVSKLPGAQARFF